MKRVYQGNWIRDHGGASERWMRNDSAAARVPATFGADIAEQPAAEEVGLTLAPPSRYRSILVPVDGGPFAEHALPLALGIARRAGAEVRVVHVHCPTQPAFRPETFYPEYGFDAATRRRQQAYLDDLSRRLRKIGSVPVTPFFLEGREVADSLCEAAGAGSDLVVMATHRRGPVARFWSGSVADELMRRLSVPLLLVPGYNAPVDLTGDPIMRRILIALDGSALAEQILEPVLALGRLTDAEHALLRVMDPKTVYPVTYGESARPQHRGEERQAEAWKYLRSMAERVEAQQLPAHPCLVLNDEAPATAIVRHAQAYDMDLIALATRGHGGISRLFHGSVADRVVRCTSVPVLVYRPNTDQEVKPTA